MDEGDLQAVWFHNGQGSKHGRKGSPDVGPQGHGQHPGLLKGNLDEVTIVEHRMENDMERTTHRDYDSIM